VSGDVIYFMDRDEVPVELYAGVDHAAGHHLRYRNGGRWTEYVAADNGQQVTDRIDG
jgi:hypothetical protein